MKLKQAFDVDIEDSVVHYHRGHGDKNIVLHGFVCDPKGRPLVHTRVIDSSGQKYSCLLYVDDLGIVKELGQCYREDEQKMLQKYMGGRGL